jgi:hypothetical protein
MISGDYGDFRDKFARLAQPVAGVDELPEGRPRFGVPSRALRSADKSGSVLQLSDPDA